ncbi:tetratricopeptide repeat protein [Phaeodactylibacter sp.]|uniref:tetratricopeptide repeat protein n=1 Tax=Phaeodactylibacter sp. TaxID=1940289 RepID=UPI0025D5870B|nr:tetratricopeptide repeat protein [Phaeodactylibacter sp.]MCI5091183.1 tetratricopeptide repeat protein [Phaeodactylibacter sp.]
MILLQGNLSPGANTPLMSWILLFLIVGIVVYRILIYPRLNRTTPKKGVSEDKVQKGKSSPLENKLGSLVKGLDGQLINSARFESPLLAAIFTKTPLQLTIAALIFIIFLFIWGEWQAGLIMLGIVALVLLFHSIRYISIWRKEEGGKDILNGLYWYYKDAQKSLDYLIKASEANDDPFIASLIAKKLDKIESLKPEEEREYSEAINWYEQVVNNPRYDISGSLDTLIWLKIGEGEYEDALHYLTILQSKYEVQSPKEYSAAYLGLAEKREFQCDVQEAIEYYEKALEIDQAVNPYLHYEIISKLTFLYGQIGDFTQSKAKANQLLKLYLEGKYKIGFREFIEEASYPFKSTSDIDGFVLMLSEGLNANATEDISIEFKSYLAAFLRAAGRPQQAEVFEQDLLQNHGKKLSADIQRKGNQPNLLHTSEGKWDWDQVIAICDEAIQESQGDKTYYYRSLIKALFYKRNSKEALDNLDTLIGLKMNDSSIYFSDEDFRLFANLYQAGCQNDKAIEVYKMWLASEEKGSSIGEDKVRWIESRIKQLS